MARRKSHSIEPSLPSASWANWQAALAGEASRRWAEFAVYTDCHCTGDMRNSGWPYQLINTIPIFDDMLESKNQGSAWRRQPQALILRVHDHLADPADQLSATWLQNSDVADELSALLSLALARRFRAGGLTRLREPGTDPEGQPYEYGRSVPELPHGGRAWSRLRLPAHREEVDLTQATPLLSLYPKISSAAAEVLLRAAVAYRGAIWIAEGDPEEAWLRLVSAVEAAASFWRAHSASDLEAVKEYRPDLYALLETKGAEFANEAATMLSPLIGSVRKFVGFLLHYLPEPPGVRPAEGAVDWGNLSPALAAIYNVRSRALHDGTSFPFEMLVPPMGVGEHFAEVFPLPSQNEGIAPMYLGTFAYIARGALANWWADLAATHPVEGRD
jgi:hypothetical protein